MERNLGRPQPLQLLLTNRINTVTYLNWLLVICVLNFPRVYISVFKPVRLLTGVTCIRLDLNTSLKSVHSVRADVCLLRYHSPRLGNFSPFCLYTTSNFKVFIIIFMVNCVYLFIFRFFGIWNIFTCLFSYY